MLCAQKVAIVTGAGGNGMGRSIALTLAREGARVVVNYRLNGVSAAAVVRQIERRGGQAFAFQADITQEEECEQLVAATVKAFGQVDICVIGPGGGWHAEPIDQLDAFDALADVQRELAPLYYLMPLVLPGMYERKWGRLIGIGLHPDQLPPAYAYNVGKAARSQALALAEAAAWAHCVTVNTICPGPVAALPNLDEALELCDHGKRWLERTTVTPQDIAEGVALLCSEAGRFITGVQLPYACH